MVELRQRAACGRLVGIVALSHTRARRVRRVAPAKAVASSPSRALGAIEGIGRPLRQERKTGRIGRIGSRNQTSLPLRTFPKSRCSARDARTSRVDVSNACHTTLNFPGPVRLTPHSPRNKGLRDGIFSKPPYSPGFVLPPPRNLQSSTEESTRARMLRHPVRRRRKLWAQGASPCTRAWRAT